MIRSVTDRQYMVIYLVMRKIRKPLILIILTYAISMIGMVLIPGKLPDGTPYYFTWFDAFYFVSYTGTTIGFGEIPVAFTQHQRMWATFSIYMTVITWLYAIGKILSLIQQDSFRSAVAEHTFKRSVRRLKSPFYIVCGFGDTGQLLIEYLDQHAIQAVVMDINPEVMNNLELYPYGAYTPGLCADVRQVGVLIEAGLHHPCCKGVIAITNDDTVNLKVAITVKVLRGNLKVVCRAETRDAQQNMASFGTDYIINPFDRFADHFALAIQAPETHLLYEWITTLDREVLKEPLYPPKGRWILCGYGRFGKAVYQNLRQAGIEVTVVEARPEATACSEFAIAGRGTEAETLRQAGIESAVGIIAGTDDDTGNLSIIVTAMELKRNLFTVARLNRYDNLEIFNKINPQITMQRSEIIARDIFTHLINHNMNHFLAKMALGDRQWINLLISRVTAVFNGDETMENWSLSISTRDAPAVVAELRQGRVVTLGQILQNPHCHTERLPVVPLMYLYAYGEVNESPADDLPLAVGDQILLFAPMRVRELMNYALFDRYTLFYLQHGYEESVSWLLGRLLRRRVASKVGQGVHETP